MKRIVNITVTCALLLSMLGIAVCTLVVGGRSMAYAFFVTYTTYLEEDAGLFGNISARITSLNSAINNNLAGKKTFEKINAVFQMKLGKQMLSFGNTTMVRLKTGQLYDLMGDTDVSDDVKTIVNLKNGLDQRGVPLVFAYAHTQLYEEDLLPTGVEDSNLKVADDIVGGLRDAGIAVVDSRQVYRDYGLTMEDAVLRTDQHWSIKTAFCTYLECVKALSGTGAVRLDLAAADPDNFDIEILKNVHMGDVGKRVGASVVEPDDLHLITPRFDTLITRRVSKPTVEGGGFDEKTGSFSEACLFLDKLEGDGPANRYDVYGLHRELTYFTNPGAPEGRLLILKDSFGTPVSTFFSLAAREICALDLRKGRLTADQIIESFQPDAVLVVYCQEMMRGKNYAFVD